MSKNIVQKIILAGVVVKNNKILILQRNKNEDVYPDIWELPSGKREPFEPSEYSLLREIKEETGLDTEIFIPISVFDYQIEKPNEIRDSTQINFLMKQKNNNDEVKLSEEHQDFTWISGDEIDNYDITDAIKDVIKKAFNFINLLNV